MFDLDCFPCVGLTDSLTIMIDRETCFFFYDWTVGYYLGDNICYSFLVPIEPWGADRWCGCTAVKYRGGVIFFQVPAGNVEAGVSSQETFCESTRDAVRESTRDILCAV